MDMSNLNLLMGSAPMGMCRMCCTDTCRCNRSKSRNTIIPPKSRPRSKSRPQSKSRPKSKSKRPQGKRFPLESSDNGNMMVPTQPPNVNPPPPTLTANQPQQGLFTGVSLNQPQQPMKPMYSEYVNQYDMYNAPPPPPPPKPSAMMNTTPMSNPAINRWYDNVDEWYNDLRLWHNTVDVMTKCNNQQRRLIHELERRQAHMLNGMKYEKMPRPIVKSIRRRPMVPMSRRPVVPDVVQNCTYECVKPPKRLPPKKRPIELPPIPKPLTPRPPPPPQPQIVITRPLPPPPPTPKLLPLPPPPTPKPMPLPPPPPPTPKRMPPTPKRMPTTPKRKPPTPKRKPPTPKKNTSLIRKTPKSPPGPNMRYIKEGFTTDYSKENSSENMNLNIVWAVLIFLLIVALIISFKSS